MRAHSGSVVGLFRNLTKEVGRAREYRPLTLILFVVFIIQSFKPSSNYNSIAVICLGIVAVVTYLIEGSHYYEIKELKALIESQNEDREKQIQELKNRVEVVALSSGFRR